MPDGNAPRLVDHSFSPLSPASKEAAMRVTPLLGSLVVLGLVSAVPAQNVRYYGCGGLNPKDSLVIKSGTSPTIGQRMTIGLDNPLKTQGCSTFTFLFMDTAPDPGFPCGTKLPAGWSMVSPTAPAELLFTPFDGYLLFVGPVWGCTPGPSYFDFDIPRALDLIGKKLYVQGMLFDLSSSVRAALTNGAELTLGPTPQQTAFGASLSGRISPSDEVDVYEFQAKAGDQLVIPYRCVTGGSFKVQLAIYDSKWRKVASVTGTDGIFRPVLSSSGPHRLAVIGASSATGDYHVDLQRIREPGGAVTKSFGDSVSSSLSPTWTDIDVYKFSALAGDQLRIPFACVTGGSFGLQLELYDAQGKLLASKAGTKGSFSPAALAAAGDYYLWISNPKRYLTGSYHFDLQRTRNPGGAVDKSFGDSISGSLAPTWTDIDIYKFSALAGDQLHVPFACVTGGSFQLQLDLYDAQGKLLGTKAGTSDIFVSTPLPSGGDYFLWVSNPSLYPTGSYHLDLQRTRAPGSAVTKSFGDSISGSLAPTWTDIDVYKFSALAGDPLYIPFARVTGGTFTLRLEIRDSQGALVATKSGDSGVFEPAPLSKTGDYYLWVKNPKRYPTGDYHLDLQRKTAFAGATPVTPGRGKVNSAISPTWTNVKVFSVALLQGLPMNALFARTTGGSFSLELTLRDAAGKIIAGPMSGNSGTLPINVPAHGTYYLWVRNPKLYLTGNFWVEVK